MLVLGLQGSPRKKGNTNFLLSAFMSEVERLGARTHTIFVDGKNIVPCKEYVVCEKKGFCPIDDDMKHEIYPLLRQADVIVAATPVFFYNATAQLKALIDRTQTLWARKYRLNLTDPNRKYRRGFFLAVGATKGKNLFEGLNLTMKYFFDALGAKDCGSLTYWQIEKPGDMQKHPLVYEDIKAAVEKLLSPFVGRKKVIFACRENACRSQIAGAFAQILGGDRLDVMTAGSRPAEKINPVMTEAMAEKGIDMAFRKPASLKDVIDSQKPDIIVTMGCGEECPFVPGVQMIDWNLPDPAGKTIEVMRELRDKIEKNVMDFINTIKI